MLPLVRALAAGREADAPLFVTSSGHRLHASAFKRTLAWGTVGEGRRIHEPRHHGLSVTGSASGSGKVQA